MYVDHPSDEVLNYICTCITPDLINFTQTIKSKTPKFRNIFITLLCSGFDKRTQATTNVP